MNFIGIGKGATVGSVLLVGILLSGCAATTGDTGSAQLAQSTATPDPTAIPETSSMNSCEYVVLPELDLTGLPDLADVDYSAMGEMIIEDDEAEPYNFPDPVTYDEANAIYKEMVNNFHLELPAGFEFPENLEDYGAPSPESRVYTPLTSPEELTQGWLSMLESAALHAHKSGDECQAREYILTLLDKKPAEYSDRIGHSALKDWYRFMVVAPFNGDYRYMEYIDCIKASFSHEYCSTAAGLET